MDRQTYSVPTTCLPDNALRYNHGAESHELSIGCEESKDQAQKGNLNRRYICSCPQEQTLESEDFYQLVKNKIEKTKGKIKISNQ